MKNITIILLLSLLWDRLGLIEKADDANVDNNILTTRMAFLEPRDKKCTFKCDFGDIQV